MPRRGPFLKAKLFRSQYKTADIKYMPEALRLTLYLLIGHGVQWAFRGRRLVEMFTYLQKSPPVLLFL